VPTASRARRSQIVVADRFVIVAPGNVHGSRDHQHVLRAQVVGGLRHEPGKLEAASALGLVIARQRVRPVEERAQAADGDPDLIGGAADSLKIGGAGLRGQVRLEVVVQLDGVEARVLRQLQALHERHLLGIGKRPEVDRLLHVVPLQIGDNLARFPVVGGCPDHDSPNENGPCCLVLSRVVWL
jgi:hypothetical protein